MKKFFSVILLCIVFFLSDAQKNIVVFQTDFGLKDGAVAAMKGVAMGVSADLKLFDLTHEIPAYNIWEASYRLQQTAMYWPTGTVFVSVVDPGVGSERKSVVLKTKNNQFFVGPDNGQFTLISESLGIAEVREIDEANNRRSNSGGSYTFHGRDVYAYTAARLAAGVIKYEQVGQLLSPNVILINYQEPVFEKGVIKGNIPVLDVQYGNVWTNIDSATFSQLHVKYGDDLQVKIYKKNSLVYEGRMPYTTTFSAVDIDKPLCYLNSLMNLSFALNQNNFAAIYKVSSGAEWTVEVSKK